MTSEDNLYIYAERETKDDDYSKARAVAIESPQQLIHKGKSVIYQRLKYIGPVQSDASFSGFYFLNVPGYAMSAPFRTNNNGKSVTAVKIERIVDETDRKEIGDYLKDDCGIKAPINFWLRDKRTPEEQERDSEMARKRRESSENELLRAMQDNPNVREFVKGLGEYLHKDRIEAQKSAKIW
jgi:hypothetical protein